MRNKVNTDIKLIKEEQWEKFRKGMERDLYDVPTTNRRQYRGTASQSYTGIVEVKHLLQQELKTKTTRQSKKTEEEMNK